MQVRQAIRTKRAIRRFAPTPLPEQVVQGIINAGRRSQSAKNSQPWHFIAILDRSSLQELAKLGTYAGHLADSALGVAILTPDPQQRWSIMFDAGQAAAYMQLAAWEMGVASCLATIYQPEVARQLLGFPAHLHLNVALSFGYPEDPSDLSRPPVRGGRRGIDEVLHIERW